MKLIILFLLFSFTMHFHIKTLKLLGKTQLFYFFQIQDFADFDSTKHRTGIGIFSASKKAIYGCENISSPETPQSDTSLFSSLLYVVSWQ